MNIINNYIKNPYVNDTGIVNNNINKIVGKEEKTQSEKTFADFLSEKLDEVNDKQIEADDITQSYIKGDETDIHNVMISAEEAKMSLEMAVQVRNKIVEAYQEISRMQL